MLLKSLLTVRGLPALLVFMLLLTGCEENALTGPDDLAPTAQIAPSSAKKSDKKAGEPIPQQFIIVLEESVADVPAVARRLARENGGELFATYQHALKGFAAKGLSAQAVEALRNSPLVKYVEQDQVFSISETQSPTPAWGIDRVDARSGLDNSYTYNATGAGVNVYVIDTGIDPNHPDFGGRAAIAYDAIGDGQNGFDCHSHGTHVAGTVGSNSYGVAKGANLLGVRVLDCDGYSVGSSVINGVDWVAANAQKPAAANMSLGGGFSQASNDAVEGLVASGVPTSVSAGNGILGIIAEDACTKSPASAPNALTVSITNQSDARVSWGGYGPCVDIFAPGAGIVSTIPGGGTASYSGTSMSAPHVAGALALYFQDNPNATSAQANNAIVSSATTGQVSNRNGTVDRLLYTLDFTGGGDPPPPPPSEDLTLSTSKQKQKGKSYANLSWSPADGGTVTVYRNGSVLTNTADDGSYRDNLGKRARGTFTYKVCETDSGDCSNESSVSF